MPRTSPRPRGQLTALKAARLKKGLTQGQLAAMVGIKPNCISRYEIGQTTPRADTAVKLAAALDITVESIFADEFIQ